MITVRTVESNLTKSVHMIQHLHARPPADAQVNCGESEPILVTWAT
jgi:hypothetical protein